MAFGAVKRWPSDKWFSLCVRERTNWVCQCCNKHLERGAMNLHCSHLFSRRHRATRWHPDNAFAHCFSCHEKLGGDPIEFSIWATSTLGPAKVNKLRVLANSTLKMTAQDRKYVAAHYKREHERMMAERAAGHVGFLQFERWNK